MFLENCEILENKEVSKNRYLMRVKSSKSIEFAKAGQFFMLEVKNKLYFLKRPISLHFVNHNEKELEFYYEVKKGGTKDIANLKIGDKIEIQGPLGSGFTTITNDKEILIIGGGMGIAPMKLLIESLKDRKITFVAGGRDKESLEILSNFNLEKVDIHVTTDDGSVGTKGSVLAKVKELMEQRRFDIVYTCGPEKMMLKIAEIAKSFSIKCEMSMEARMACGVKACVGCSIKTKHGMKKVCFDGPVFDSEIILDVNPQVESNVCCSKH